MEGTLRILIVDDDEVDRMAVIRALMKAGLEVDCVEAGTYADAIAHLQHNQFDCVFLDFRLPDQDGLTLVKQVRQSGTRVPLVVLTGQGDEQIAVDLMKAGATDYMSKARVSAETLGQVLRNAVRVYRAEMQVALANQRLRESNDLLIRKNHELEQQRQQIQLQNLKLLEASRLKSQFLATMSHELRTPMNAIIGFSQLLLRPSKGTLTRQQQDMVERIFNNGKHLMELLNDILDLSKIEAGRLELKCESLNLEQVIRLTVEELRSLADDKNLTLDVVLNLQNPMITNDTNRLRQVLVNLLSNAIKFTEQGSICVEVNELPSDHLAIAVHDTGIGIDSTHLEHIFEAFRQIDQTITRKHSGTGLGLAITESLVQMMNGSIEVESELGKGSMFKVQIPRHITSMPVDKTDQPFKLKDVESMQAGSTHFN